MQNSKLFNKNKYDEFITFIGIILNSRMSDGFCKNSMYLP